MKKAKTLLLGIFMVLLAITMIGCGGEEIKLIDISIASNPADAKITTADGSVTLTATVSNYESDKSVTWSNKGNSTDAQTDDSDKIVVTPQADGTCVVTVKDGYNTAGEDKTVTVYATSVEDTYRYGKIVITLNITTGTPEPGPEPAVETQTLPGTWDFASLASVACEGVDASTAIADATALAAATTAYTSFGGAGEVKFSIKADVEYPSTTGNMKLIVKSLDADGVPIQYNKYEATKSVGDGSAGCLQPKKDACIIKNVKGPFTCTMIYSTNSSSDKTDRYAYIKIGETENKDTVYPDSVPAAGSTMTATYTGTDTVDVVFGATNSIRIFDISITAN